jgi:hypothetical protein
MPDLAPSRTPLRSSPPAAPTVRQDTVPPASLPPVRIREDAFVAEATVDGWVRAGAVTRAGMLLTVHDGRCLVLRDAVRVLGRRNGDTDPYGFTGCVDAVRELIRRGASISVDALKLGPAVYDIEYGFMAAELLPAAAR